MRRPPMVTPLAEYVAFLRSETAWQQRESALYPAWLRARTDQHQRQAENLARQIIGLLEGPLTTGRAKLAVTMAHKRLEAIDRIADIVSQAKLDRDLALARQAKRAGLET